VDDQDIPAIVCLRMCRVLRHVQIFKQKKSHSLAVINYLACSRQSTMPFNTSWLLFSKGDIFLWQWMHGFQLLKLAMSCALWILLTKRPGSFAVLFLDSMRRQGAQEPKIVFSMLRSRWTTINFHTVKWLLWLLTLKLLWLLMEGCLLSAADRLREIQDGMDVLITNWSLLQG
jgi:hypothetical protein